MKARSLVFDLFGDYLRYRRPGPAAALVALLGCFGIPEAPPHGSRPSAAEGRVARGGHGRRETVYALTDDAWQMLDDGRAGSSTARTARGTASGTWSSTRSRDRAGVREQLRRRLAWLGFGRSSSSVWLSPHDRSQQVTTTSRVPVGADSTPSAPGQRGPAPTGTSPRAPGTWPLSTVTTVTCSPATAPRLAGVPRRRAGRPDGPGRADAAGPRLPALPVPRSRPARGAAASRLARSPGARRLPSGARPAPRAGGTASWTELTEGNAARRQADLDLECVIL